MKKIVIFLMLFIYSFSLEIGNKVLEQRKEASTPTITPRFQFRK
jgi:hypothetical protein